MGDRKIPTTGSARSVRPSGPGPPPTPLFWKFRATQGLPTCTTRTTHHTKPGVFYFAGFISQILSQRSVRLATEQSSSLTAFLTNSAETTEKLMLHALPSRSAWPAGQHAAAATSPSAFAFAHQARKGGRMCKPNRSHNLLYEGRRMACNCPCNAQQIQCLATQGNPRLVQWAVVVPPEVAAPLGHSSRLAGWPRTMVSSRSQPLATASSLPSECNQQGVHQHQANPPNANL